MFWKIILVLFSFCYTIYGDDPIVEITETDPKKNTVYNQIIVEKDKDAQLRCIVQNLPQDREVKWQALLANDSVVPISSSTAIKSDPFKYAIDTPSPNSWRLRIQNAQFTDDGAYFCRVPVGDQNYVETYEYVRVIEKPQIADLQTSSDYVAKKGDDVPLTCNATGRPFPAVRWRRLAGELLPSGGQELRDYRLNILNVQPANAGIYICLADNEAGHDERRILVAVKHSPIVKAEEKRVKQAIGYVKSLVCNVEANPEPYVSWSRENIPMQFNGHTEVRTIVGALNKVTSILTIYGVGIEDYGNYTCLAANTQGEGVDHMILELSNEPTPDRTGQYTSSASLLARSFITVIMVFTNFIFF